MERHKDFVLYMYKWNLIFTLKISNLAILHNILIKENDCDIKQLIGSSILYLKYILINNHNYM